MTNLEILLSRREKLVERLNGILAGMCDDDEHEVANKITRINFVIAKIKRQYWARFSRPKEKKKCQ
jgi:hypothetical protein|tara:strand:+ start:1627 stop:1824 length:198 start_codon:yes stop_codon:yes gene_type:complete